MTSEFLGADNLDSADHDFGIPKAWAVIDNEGVFTVRASKNITSATDVAVGKFSLVFDNAAPDTNICFCCTGGGVNSDGQGRCVSLVADSGLSTTGALFHQLNGSNSYVDENRIGIEVYHK